ncbi:hypothetical protein E3P81_01070 [Wallemia ichthyophaga]|uniref:Membrane protein C6F6.13c n=1 Tax=Wallemia ichthyophaga TaxID=245174 RepID=A0A4T0J9A7_WALIC|nr:hypothetical protein E3P97_01071 [Wallemia ichthyophaga]TIB30820.1 hypothetical protein E3P85_02560 [Wallemia ichthyophaga]TIB39213.1 hypothetical protein E3P86_01233 [Wallemia ichthyophaga]TIB49097.1 hypothetical protein E3P82_01069 [Wallemia ichthyophaga]TIB52980.1 hypothetical protein E3P81_01070 [Wallemia ichthyophaga]
MTRSKSESKAAEDEGWTSASSTNETPEKSPSESPRLTQSQSQPDLSSLPGQLKRLNLVNVGGNGCNVEDPEESDVNTPKPSSSYSFTNVPPRPSSITSTTSSKAPPSVFKMSSPLAQVDTKTVAHAADSPTNTSTTNLQDNLAAKLGYKSSLGAISRQNIGTPALRTPPAKSHLVISNFTPAGSQDLPPTPTYSRLTTYSNLKSSHTALRTFFHPQKDSLERCGRYGKFDPPPKWFEPVKNNHHPFFHPRKPNQLRNLPRPKSMHPESTPKLSPGSTRSSFGQAISGVQSDKPDRPERSEISSELQLSAEVSIAFACAAKLSAMEVLERAPPAQKGNWEVECNAWLERVAKILKIDYESLPPEPTHQAIRWLASEIPPHTHKSVVPSFVMASLSRQKNDLPEYTALSRACMRSMLTVLSIDLQLLRMAECQTATTIWMTVKDNLNSDSEKARSQRADKQKWIRWAATGTGVVVGGVVLGLTGGLAAPALAPLFAALPALGFFATGGGAIAIGVMFGLTGGGLGGYRVARRTAGISEFKFVPLKNEVLFDGALGKGSLPTRKVDPEYRPPYEIRSKSSSSNSLSTLGTPTDKYKPPVPPKPPTIKAKSQAEERKIASDIPAKRPVKAPAKQPDTPFSFKKMGNSFEQFGSKTMVGMRKFGDTISDGVANIGINNKTEEEKEAERATENAEVAPAMTATVCATGLLLNAPQESVNVWRESFGDIANAEDDQRDVYALTTDASYFVDAGKQINGWVIEKIINMAGSQILGVTALGAFMAATAVPLGLISATGMVIDNAWQGAVDRAKKAGDILSDVIRDRVHGKRPLALIGHSLGALMLVRALLNLPAPDTPIISTLTLIALPASLSEQEWLHLRAFVADEITNAYVPNDIVLAMVCRLHEVLTIRNPRTSVRVAGLGPVNDEQVEKTKADNEENKSPDGTKAVIEQVAVSGRKSHIRDVDLSGVLEGHFDILEPSKMKQVLEVIDIE